MKKLLTSTALSILLVSLASGVYGQNIETINLPDGSVYVGEVRDGQGHGQGTYTWSKGDVHVGEYRNGQKNGQGTLTFADGDVYIGEFRDDQFNGQGTYTYTYANETEGGVYVGEFSDGLRNGQGTYTFADGRVDNGIWRNNIFVEANSIATIPFVPERIDPIVPESNELLQAASGSGFAVSYEGHIITNNHIIEGCENVRIHRQGTTIDAVVVSRDPLNDLAVIKADFSPSAVFAIDNSNPQLMQDIYVAGYPFGQNISSSLKVTRGIVSSLTGIGNNFSNMQIDAAIQPGNSGGPIFDEGGNVIGVAVATLNISVALEEFGAIPQNTNFGVKANVVSNFLVSNGIETVDSNTTPMTTSELGQLATDATYYLSCWMTTAQIQQMSSTKVMFQDLGQ
jgi:hypothetical protein